MVCATEALEWAYRTGVLYCVAPFGVYNLANIMFRSQAFGPTQLG